MHSIHLDRVRVHAEEDSISPDSQSIMISLAFELLDVTGELILQEVNTVADILSNVVREQTYLLAASSDNDR